MEPIGILAANKSNRFTGGYRFRYITADLLEEGMEVVGEEYFFADKQKKEIDGFHEDVLGASITASSTKAEAMDRFLRMAFATLPLQQATVIKPKATKAQKKMFWFCYDPQNESHVATYAEMAPHAQASLLAGLGMRKLPTESTIVAVPYADILQRFEQYRDLFLTQQNLHTVLNNYRQHMASVGFLRVTGETDEPKNSKTDRKIFRFEMPRTTAERDAALHILAPQGSQGVPQLLRVILGDYIYEFGGTLEIQGLDLKVLLDKAKRDGRLVTRQYPFRLFQFKERLITSAGLLTVKI